MTSKTPKAEYAPRDAAELEPFYSRHVSAMTAEGLHSKSAIAAELAYRDKALTDTQAKLARALDAIGTARHYLKAAMPERANAHLRDFIASLEEGKGDK